MPSILPWMDAILKLIEGQKDDSLALLREFVAIPSVSGDPARKGDCLRAAQWVEDQLKRAGAQTSQWVKEGEDMHPVVYGEVGSDPRKKTVLVYGHYDVQPAEMHDGWSADPWTLRGPDERGFVYGRGVTDDKGQVLAILRAAQAFAETNTELPVNLKFLIEGMEETGGDALLAAVIEEHRETFETLDAVLVCDSEWIGEEIPTVLHALRGIVYLEVIVHGAKADMHSGVMGGAVWEPLQDAVNLVSSLRDGPMGQVKIPGFYDAVRPVTDDLRTHLRASKYNLDEAKAEHGLSSYAHPEREDVLLAQYYQPTLTFHGFGHVFNGPGTKTVIPGKASAYVSMRLVPDQDPHDIARRAKDYVESVFQASGSPNRLEVTVHDPGMWWYGDTSDPYIQAGLRAASKGFGREAVLIAEGGTIPIIAMLSQLASPVLVSLAKGYSNLHGPNERFHVDSLVDGAKTVALFFEEVSKTGNSGS